GAGGGTTGATNTAAAARGGGGQAAGALAARPTGKITAIDGTTVTLDTPAGSRKVSVSPSTTVSKLTGGSQGDLKVGDMIIVAGSATPDGSGFQATSVSQVPPELAQLVEGISGAGQGTNGAGSNTQ